MKSGTTFVLVNSEGKILLQKRDDGRGKTIPYPNTWCIPGGSLDKGEAYLQNVLREVKEEYNISVAEKDCHLVCTYNHDDITDDHVFVCHTGDQVPELHEGADMKWVDPKELKNLSLGWEQEKIVEEILKSL